MKKCFTTLALFAMALTTQAQVTQTETFDNLPEVPSYADGSFTGNYGIDWTYKAGRTVPEYQIDEESLLLRRISDSSSVWANDIPNTDTITTIAVDLKKGFTGGGDRQVEMIVNGTSVGTSIVFDDTLVHNFEVTGLNITGDFDLKLLNIKSKQVVVDNIAWSTSSGNEPTTPSANFTNSADTVNLSAFAADLPLSENLGFSYQNFTHTVDGLVSYAVVDPGLNLDNDTNSTGSIALSLDEFGSFIIAVGFTDFAGNPLPHPGDTIIYVVEENVITDVADVATLRASTEGELYQLTGEVVISQINSFRNQKYIQDATGGILIDDPNGIITTSFDIYDGMMNIKGELSSYNGMMQFLPMENVASASSTGNTLTPVVVTIADFNANFNDYESELIRIENALVTGGTTFEAGLNYDINDATGAAVLRTSFYDADYIDEDILAVNANYTGVAIEFNGAAQISPRMQTDIVSLGLDELSNGQQVYPNPVEDVLYLDFDNQTERTVQVYNALGLKVVEFVSEGNVSYDASKLASGVYYISVLENGTWSQTNFV
ncbi:MAG: DUF5689 domain-containing protein, partial [Flavobacteriales bacterium]